MNINNLIESVRSFVIPYYERNDSAHKIAHADSVCCLALKLNDFLPIEKRVEVPLIILASYFHDVAASDRKVHHIKAAEIVRTIDFEFLVDLDAKDREIVALACLEHRASYSGEFSSMLSEIISSADRGKPALQYHLQRSIQFNMDRENMTYDAARINACLHMKDKYGEGGYANYPNLYKTYFADQLDQLAFEIELL